ncbi:exopolysaccharide biosynthesis polyprenyl glycosylphosphotransferase [Nocardioides marmoribigeumensis]|uniref:Exopolysaccharide biosynthesis polyprenyl glycosylphosphotransferase n=1 Tax=Nocardioides marmoribigeumensis TaxID=433649 RepID=A0ABU2BZH8_9ACTN|nr:exopolysaccharide biosynthesis polyprenyl glycosylphosphotransferase [Nocardioides marmoribigeumensis]MDR7363799.1 exopolysaccharide biosynthesis polyprenyl glycosylphosphotransferase [Nocardioides marmoribigeumensis]
MPTMPSTGTATTARGMQRSVARSVPAEQRRRGAIHLEVGLAMMAAATTALTMTTDAVLLCGQLVLWGTLAYRRSVPLAGPPLRQVRPLFQSLGIVLALTSLGIALGLNDLAGPALALPICAAALAAAVGRLLMLRLAGPMRVLVVGDLMAASRAGLTWRGSRQVKVVGNIVVQPEQTSAEPLKELLGVPVWSDLDQLPALAEASQADLVVLAPGTGLTSADVRRITWALQDHHAGVAMLGLFDAVAPERIRAGRLGNETLCEIDPPKGSPVATFLKGAFDRLAAALLLVVAAPVMAAVALAVKLDSRGPVLFRQTRVGRHGALFTVLKVRTMRSDAEEVKAELIDSNEFDGVLFKIKRDPRVTRVGQFLRKFSLDELPQLLNVLRGEMSLIGPRPFLPAETAQMAADDLRRLAVKPGITGLWQVSGRSDLDWDESVALDTYYADNWSLGSDVQIALRTVGAVINAKGAY